MLMQLKEAISLRLKELLQEKGMTQYQLFLKSGVPKSTIHNVIHGNVPGLGDQPEHVFHLPRL